MIVVLNLVDEVGETPGFGPADHLAVLAEHAPDLKVHTVLVDAGGAPQDLAELEHVVAAYGASLAVARRRREPGQRAPRPGQAGGRVRRDHGAVDPTRNTRNPTGSEGC